MLLFSWIPLLILLPQEAMGQRIQFRSYGVEDGLCQSQVMTTTQGPDGFLWIGTQHGVSRFDGSDFVTYTQRDGLLQNTVLSSFRDRRNHIWFCHPNGGLTRLVNGEFQHFPPDEERRGSEIHCIAQDSEGRIWVSSEGAGIIVLSETAAPGTILKKGGSPNYVYSLLPTDHGVWIGSSNGLYYGTIEGEIEDTVPTLDLQRVGGRRLRGAAITSLVEDPEGRLWIGVAERGLFMLEAQEGEEEAFQRRIHYITTRDDLPQGGVEDIQFGPGGSLWVASINQGVWRLQPEGKEGIIVKAKVFNRDNGLGYDNVGEIFCDREQNLWFATNGGGISVFRWNPFTTTSHSSDPHALSVWAIFEDRDQVLWFGTDGGLLRYGKLDEEGQNIQVFGQKNGIENESIHTIVQGPAGYLWLCPAEGGLIRFDPETEDILVFHEGHGIVGSERYDAAIDDQGTLWLTGDKRLLQVALPEEKQEQGFDPDQMEKYLLGAGQNGEIWAHSILLGRDKTIWLCTSDGVAQFLPKETSPKKRFSFYGINSGSETPEVVTLCEDDEGGFWALTDQGTLYSFNGRRFLKIDLEPLCGDVVYLLACHQKSVFLGTNNGIYKYDPNQKTFKHYGQRDGFQGVETNGDAVGFDHDGGLWVGTVRGAARYDSTAERINRVPPQIHLNQVSVFLEPIPIESGNVFSHDKNHITFEFVGISLTDPDRVQYEYCLRGLGESRKTTTDRGFVSYSNLPPGEYTFEIKAANGDGVWSTTPLTYSFTIEAPFWGTWWFDPLCILLAIGVIFGGFRWRTGTMTRLNKKLERVVEERTEEVTLRSNEVQKANTALEKALRAATQASEAKAIFLANMSHEIRTPLNGVIGMTDLLFDTELNGEQLEYTRTVSDSGKALLAIINDVLDFSKIEAGKLEIDPVEFSLSQRVGSVLRILAQSAHQKAIELWCDIEAEVPDRIEGDALRLGQVLTNLISNAVKFTHEGEVVIKIRQQKDLEAQNQIRIRVIDSGIGITPEKQEEIFDAFSQEDSSTTRKFGGTGLGLAISSRLVDLMGGNLIVSSTPGSGSTFEFTLPLTPREPPSRLGWMRGKKILLALHHATAARILEGTLSSWGARPILAPRDENDSCSNLVDLHETFDAVVIERNLAESGHELLQSLRDDPRWANIPVLLLKHHERRGRGVDPESELDCVIMKKPFTLGDIQESFEELFRRKSPTANSRADTNKEMEDLLPSLRILLVEDNAVNQKVAVRLLEKSGNSVIVAGNGREALEVLESGQRFDLVFMDVQMPEMDGFQATKAIRIRERGTGVHLPIVAMTAHAVKGDRERCLDSGMDDYISKPIDARKLKKVVASYAEQKRLDDPGPQLA